MNKELYKASTRRPKSSPNHHEAEDLEIQPKVKRKKGSHFATKTPVITTMTLLNFCDIVLRYENYPNCEVEDYRKNASSPLDSNGSTADSFSSESTVSCSTPEMEDTSSSDFRSRHKSQKQVPHSATASPGKENKSKYDFSAGVLQGKQNAGSPTGSPPSNPPSPTDKINAESIITSPEDEEDESITCFCKKPYGGRPMIQCESCTRWIHYSCAKVRKNKVPDTFYCHECKKTRNGKPIKLSYYDNHIASASAIIL